MSKDLVGKRAVVYFNDTPTSVNRYEGIITKLDSSFIRVDGRINIPISKLIRVEMVDGVKDEKT